MAFHLTAGDVAQLVLVLALALGLWRLTRGGAGYAVQELSAANRVLERRNHELGAQVRDLRIKLARLESRTDFAAVMDAHERNAAARSAAVLQVLDLIASRLGPDPGHETDHPAAA